MAADITILEVKDRLGSLKLLKAPGPDGFHASSFWPFGVLWGTQFLTKLKISSLALLCPATSMKLLLPLFQNILGLTTWLLSGQSVCVIRSTKL